MKKNITFLMSLLFVLCTSHAFAQYDNIDFESASTGSGFTWIMDQNGSNPPLTFIANPVSGGINTTATVAKFTAMQSGQPWALTFTDDADAFTFDATNKIVKIMVYKTVISNIGLKFEGASPAVEILVPNTVVNAWEEITFDFSASIGNSYNRLVIIPDFNMAGRTQDNVIYFDNVQVPSGAASTTSNVTFKVDMTQYTGSTANGVFVNGTFNGWCGSCNPMTDANADGIWEVTLPLTNAQIEWKFTVDGWNAQEMFAGGEPCTMTTGPNTNRVATISQDVTFPAVCWNSCTTCGGGVSTVNVTYKVNAALVTTDPAGLFLAGGTLFGGPGDNPMTDANGDDVWEITVAVPVGTTFDYTFTNGNCPNWGCKENIAGLPCAVQPYSDRRSMGVYSDTTILACFGACESDGTCPVPATPINVTFQVDMNHETVSGGVFLGGNFEGWSGGQVLTDANADGIWDITMTLNSGSSIEWKFINGANWASPEQFDSLDAGCTLNTGGFINRYATLGSSDTTLPAFLFDSCDVATSTKPIFTKTELFSIAPTLVTDATIINFNESIIAADKQIRVMNAVGQVVMSETIGQTEQYRLDASNLTNGLYFVVIQSEGFAQTARIIVSK